MARSTESDASPAPSRSLVIDDPLDEKELMISLVLRAQPSESGKNKDKTGEKEPDREPFPWEIPFPDEQEWQNFLAGLFHELRGEPAAQPGGKA